MQKRLYKVAKLVKVTDTCTDLPVLVHEQLIQLISIYILYLFVKS